MKTYDEYRDAKITENVSFRTWVLALIAECNKRGMECNHYVHNNQVVINFRNPAKITFEILLELPGYTRHIEIVNDVTLHITPINELITLD